jgi:hypothetical protein
VKIHVGARIALVIAALACAAWLREGHYAIGLDFQGGARVVVHPHGDPQKTLLDALAIRPDATVRIAGDRVEIEPASGGADDVNALTGGLAAEADIVSSIVIESSWPPALGRPLATVIAFIAALCWLGAWLKPRVWVLPIAATFALAWAVTLVDQLAIGGTLTLPVQLSGVLLGAAAAIAAWPGDGDPIARLRSAWPAGVALLALLVASVVVAALVPRAPLSGDLERTAYFAIKLVRHPAIAVASIAALAAIASVRSGES